MLKHINNRIIRQFSTSSDRSKYKEIEIPVPWGKVAGKEWGETEGHPWLGLHGWLDNAGSLDLIAKDWPAGHKLIAIDFPGHGLSSQLPYGSMYHYLEASLLIERIRKYYKWDKFSLIGHSMGGGHGVCYSGLFPDKVEHLIMIDLVRPVCRPADLAVKRSREAIEQQLSVEDRFQNNLHGKVYGSWDEAFNRLKEGAFAENSEEAYQILSERGIQKFGEEEAWVFSRDMRHRVTSLYGIHPQYFAQIAANISVHHLLIKATESPNYEPDDVIEEVMNIYKKNEKFVYREVEGNHHLHLNTPERVLPVILQFIQQCNTDSS